VTSETPGYRKTDTTVVEWYAPSVNRYVKRTYDSRQNGKAFDSYQEVLTNYSRRESN
jgi:hypothetical protein